jgi:hypothetical protein
MQLVFASNNKNKIKEIQLLVPQYIHVLSLEDIGCFEEIPETADTIEGNAIQKANYITEKYGYNCFADDTGLEVVALNGEPGVYSARYAGEQKDATDNMDKLLNNLKGISHTLYIYMENTTTEPINEEEATKQQQKLAELRRYNREYYHAHKKRPRDASAVRRYSRASTP